MKSNVLIVILIVLCIALCVSPAVALGSTHFHIVSGTWEGNLQKSAGSGGDTWVAIRDAPTSSSILTDNVAVAALRGTSKTDKWYYIQRGYMIFNTSSIPEGEDAYEAILSVRVGSKSNTFSETPYVYLFQFTPGTYSSITVDDYNDFDFGINQVCYSWDTFTAGARVNLTIDPDLVDSDGYTAIGVALSWDHDNSSPEWQGDKIAVISFSNGAEEYEPVLYVNYATSVSVAADVIGDYDQYDTPTLKTTVNGYSGEYNITYYPVLYVGDGGTIVWSEVYDTWHNETSHQDDVYLPYDTDYQFLAHVNINDVDYYAWNNFTANFSEYPTPTPTPTIPPTANYEVIVSGLDTEPIEDANVSIWYNGAYQDSELTFATGSAYFVVPPYRFVNGTVTLSGYQTAYFDTYVYPSGSFEIVTLYTDDETQGSGDEYWNYVVTFRDASTLATLTNVQIDAYTDSGRTDLFLSDNAPYGVWTGLLPNDTTYYFTASAANHVNATWSYTLSGSSISVYKDLIPVTYGSLQPVLNIFVYDTGGTALKDVGITVDSDIDDGFHLTNISGYARHFCSNLAYGSSRNYTVTASKGGYVTETSVVTVSTQQPTVYVFLDKSTVATATPTGIYTPVITPVWSGDGGTPGNIKEQLINTIMTQFGVSQLEANILMGIILTLLCAVIVGGGLASYGSGSGAGVGAMIGAVVGFSGSSIIGFFPIWILIVVIVLVFAAWFIFRGRDE